MQRNLSEHQRYKYLQALGIPVWVQRKTQQEFVVDAPHHLPATPETQALHSLDSPHYSGSSTTGNLSEILSESKENRLQTPTPEIQDPDKKTPKAERIDCSQMDWESLQAQISSCQSCTLHTSRNQAIFGSGDPAAQYMIIGDAPSSDDDRQGHPFLGESGQLLTNMLLAIGLHRNTVYLTNTVKCRPPNNRPPSKDELIHCENYLYRQIELIKPEAILILGRTTAQSLLKVKSPLSTLRGQIHSLPVIELPAVVTYHPQYLLRQAKDKRKAWEDLKLFKQIKISKDSGLNN